MCDTWLPNGQPHPSNTRVKAKEIFDQKLQLKPWFGIEQEFFLSKTNDLSHFRTKPCLILNVTIIVELGRDNAIGRKCIEEAFLKCLQAGLHLTGMNAEVAPAQWEFQVCTEGIAVADELYVMRYIIDRVAEDYGWNIDIHPKPIQGDWNGSGCHTNFSTEPMRQAGGYTEIEKCTQTLV